MTRTLTTEERLILSILGLPTVAMALAITAVSSYVPVLAREQFDSTTVVGVLIGIEGIMAILVPPTVGVWSDHLRSPLGARVPFVVAATPLMVISLLILGFAGNGTVIALAITAFFFAYFVAYEPYRAMYADLTDVEIAGRAQATQALWRGAGTGLALVGGGLLLAVYQPLPFVAAALFVFVTVFVFVRLVVSRKIVRDTAQDGRPSAGELISLVRGRPELRVFLVANALWEASLGALKTFVFLFIIDGLGQSEPAAAGIIGGVAIVALLATPVSGRLGDRIGRARLLLYVLPLYGVGLMIPAATQSIAVMVPVMIAVGFGGGMVMALPYAILQPLMPQGHHGALTGFYSVSRGVGAGFGPLLAGIAIQVLEDPFSSTDGYAAMWLVCGATVLLSILPLRRLIAMGAA